MAGNLNETFPVMLRPIELALLLSHARRMPSYNDPLNQSNPAENQAWREIERALFEALSPSKSR